MSKVKKTLSYLSTLAGATLVVPVATLATAGEVNLNLPAGTQFANVAGYTPSGLARSLINLILVLSGLVAFFFLLWGGLQWIMAGGDKEGTEKARKRITAALIGLVVVFSAYAILALAGSFLGLDLLTLNILSISDAN